LESLKVSGRLRINAPGPHKVGSIGGDPTPSAPSSPAPRGFFNLNQFQRPIPVNRFIQMGSDLDHARYK
jgi:hypothetical protein